ncbi:LOW QUALITY PROTEIN: uncharacterized protein LOC132927594 [Rhopalosiphum padi]|uniref:LOW QUALITY PROTEIN: uncharacterized protein LOC132927594 n=1 Tax=Rhopalosiphum padi TaxID=40932 RepID=UPI00298E6FE1|nr:LOW QUALITY PROTEIN: uncharacterized protein LOC132927594 [Rhopalosiphum padi]
MGSNNIGGLLRFSDDFPWLQVIRSPPPSRRVTLLHNRLKAETTQDHLVATLRHRYIRRRHHLRSDTDGAAFNDLSNTDEDSDDDYFNQHVHEEMNNSINILFENNKPVEELNFALDVIDEIINKIDYANEFVKLGGFHIFLPCFRSEHSSVRIKICNFIFKLVQNNPFCQNKFMENTNTIVNTKLQALMYLVENDNDYEVRTKALFAIYGLVHRNVSVFWQFIAHGGKDLILNSLQTSINKLKIKAVLLIFSTVCNMGNVVAELYIDNGVVEIISSIIMGMENIVDSNHHTLVLLTLNQFIHLSPVRVKEICSSVEDFKQALISLRDLYSNKSKYEATKEQILLLMEKLTL